MGTQRLTKTVVERAAATGKDFFIWDAAPKGFGVKVSAAGTRTFVVQYRLAGGRTARTKRVTIGKFGSPWTVENARKEAERILSDVVRGHDPAEEKTRLGRTPTVAALCDQYLIEGVGTKKASTLVSDRGRIEGHIKPLLGQIKVTEISRNHIVKFQSDVANGKTARDQKTGPRGRSIVTGGRGAASRTVGLLSGIFTFAVNAGILQSNPVLGVRRFKDKKNHRFLSEAEFARIGQALIATEDEGKNPAAIAIIRILMFTGARRGEIEKLRWVEVDLETRCLRLEDSKTGQKIIPLSSGACDLIRAYDERFGRHRGAYVFQSDDYDGHYSGTPRVWTRVRGKAGFPGLRLHDLRHSFASLGLSHGRSLSILGALLGHRDHSTTQRYAHLSDDPIRAATEEIGEAISRAIASKDAALNHDEK